MAITDTGNLRSQTTWHGWLGRRMWQSIKSRCSQTSTRLAGRRELPPLQQLLTRSRFHNLPASRRRLLATQVACPPAGFTAEILEDRTLLASQIVDPTPAEQTIAADTAVSFDLIYTTADPFDETLTGLGLRVHYDSSQLTMPDLTNVLMTNLIAENDPSPDNGNQDGDANTDMVIVLAWTNPFNGSWPGNGTLPARLFTANFVTAADFNSGATAVNFTASSTSQGFDFVGTPAVINADVPPTVTLNVDNANIAEAGGVATFTASLSAIATKDVTVNLGFAGTATGGGVDYTASGTQIVIPSGSPSGSVTVTAMPDAANELDETVIVNITSVVNGIEDGVQAATTTITDDDVVSVDLSADTTSIAENGGAAVISATLSAVAAQDVTVDLAFSGTATGGGTDYNAPGTQIVIPAGSTTHSITVTAVDDLLDEPNETVIVEIAGVTNADENGDQSQTLTILDDDEPLVADIVDVIPDPRMSAVGIVTINFNRDVTGVDQSDFVLLLGSTVLSLASAPLVEVTPQRYTLDLSELTDVDGAYLLTLVASGSGISDGANALSGNAADGWVRTSVALQPPELAPIDDQILELTQNSVTVPLEATNPNIGDMVSFTASAQTSEYLVQQEFGLQTTGNLFQNFGGLNEKWLLGTGNQWYYITPVGEVFAWNGTGSRFLVDPTDPIGGDLVAVLSGLAYADPARIYDAQPNMPGVDLSITDNDLTVDLPENFSGRVEVAVTATNAGGDDMTTFLVQKGATLDHITDLAVGYGLRVVSQDFSLNAYGANEKWLRGPGGGPWYFIVHGGDMFRWDGTVGSATGVFVSNVGDSNYDNPQALIDAKANRQVSIDRELDLNYTGSYAFNWGGLEEKWMQAGDSAWYFVRRDGRLYQWDGADDLSTSTLIATVDAAVWNKPSRLHDAFVPPTPLPTAHLTTVPSTAALLRTDLVDRIFEFEFELVGG